MKILTVFVLTVFLAVPAFGATGDITKAEDRPNVVSWALDTVTFRVFTQTAEVTYRKVDGSSNPVGEETTISFKNVSDNPDTPEDETSTEFTQLIQAINSGSNIKTTVTNAVKTKLGI